MKKLILSLLTFIVALQFATAQNEKYNIKVKLNTNNEGKYVYLAHYYGYDQYIKVDSAISQNGFLNFKGTESLKGGIYLIVLSPSKFYDIIVSGNEPNIEVEADTSDFVNTVKFKGSNENEVLFGYRQFLNKKSNEAQQLSKNIQSSKDAKVVESNKAKLGDLQKEVMSFMSSAVLKSKGTFASKIINANLDPESPKVLPLKSDGKPDSTYLFTHYKAHYFDNIDFTDERMLRTPFIHSKIERYFKDLVYQVTDSVKKDADHVLKLAKKNPEVYRYVLYKITNKYENIDIVGLDGVFIHLAENYYLKDATWLDSSQIAKFRERVGILKPIQTGNVFPSLILQDSLGKDYNVAANKAKYTVVNFYSPDCGHCKDSAPKLVKFSDDNISKGIEVINVSIDYEVDKMKKFITTYKTGKMKNLWDSKARYAFRNRYDVYSTPTTYVLDSQNRILGKRIPIEELEKFIEFQESKNKKK
jgi:thiol-disulfide isomerase/thioredoxin